MIRIRFTGTQHQHCGKGSWVGPSRPMLSGMCAQLHDTQDAGLWTISYSEPLEVTLDPQNYDMVVIGLYTLGGYTTMERVPRVHQLVTWLKARGIPFCFAIEDAYYERHIEGLRRWVQDGNWQWRITKKLELSPLEVADVDASALAFEAGDHPDLIVNAHHWFSFDNFERETTWRPTIAVDPSFLADIYGQIDDTSKKLRQWTFATSKVNVNRWFDDRVLWPLEEFGPPTADKPNRKWKPEKHVVASYQRSWGTLTHNYSHSGKGWWRPRFGMAANSLCIACCPGELEHLGPAYQFGPEWVEAVTDSERYDLALYQRHTWKQNVPTRDQFIGSLYKYLSSKVG